MKQVIEGSPSFARIDVTLEPGDRIIAESDAMASMDPRISHQAKLNGGLIKGILRRVLGGESVFINHYSNKTNEPLSMTLTQATPGDIKMIELKGDGLYMQPGAFICCTPGVKLSLKWAGIRSWFAREGLFRIYVEGNGSVWLGGYGHIYEKEIDGAYLIDTSHVLGYDPAMAIKIQLSGGLISSFLSGEGFLSRMEGKGKVLLQSRSMGGLVGFLNPRI
jgi:uncharacterized protein (TIGR00266 family)